MASHQSPDVQIIKRIEQRLSWITFLPPENGEGIQILKYIVRSNACT